MPFRSVANPQLPYTSIFAPSPSSHNLLYMSALAKRRPNKSLYLSIGVQAPDSSIVYVKGPCSTHSPSLRNPHYSSPSVGEALSKVAPAIPHQDHVTTSPDEQIQNITTGFRSTIPLIFRLAPEVQERIERLGLPVEEQSGNPVGGPQVVFDSFFVVPADDVRVSDWCTGRESGVGVKVSERYVFASVLILVHCLQALRSFVTSIGFLLNML